MTRDATRHLPPHFHAGVHDRLTEAGRSPAAARAMIDLDSAMFLWFRVVAQGGFTAPLLAGLETEVDMTRFRALTAIARLAHGIGRAAPTAPTIGALAEELGIDPSRASRIAADLIEAGLVRREAAQEDGRKSVLALTGRSVAIFEAYRDAKWERYRAVFDGWPDADIESFARLFARFFDGMAEAHGVVLPDSGERA